MTRRGYEIGLPILLPVLLTLRVRGVMLAAYERKDCRAECGGVYSARSAMGCRDGPNE